MTTIAYIMSRFPKISETFILQEMIALERLGLCIEIFPLLRQREPIMHRRAKPYARRACYPDLFSLSMIAAQWYWLRKKPAQYILCWLRAIAGNARYFKFLVRALYVVPVAAFFARKMRDLNVSMIHAHWATHPALAAWIVNQLTGIDYSITTHAHDIYVKRPMLAQKLRDARFVVTISEYNKRFLEGLYGKEIGRSIHVIHCGVDPRMFMPQVRTSHRRSFAILCVGSLSNYKGQSFLVQACALLKQRGIRFRCLFVGDGQERPSLDALIHDLGMERYVFLLGWKTQSRVKKLMTNSDVVVLPSVTTKSGKMEGIPVALMEAMAMEIPVVSTGISGIPELVHHGLTGLIVPEKDATALAEALQWLHDNPQLRWQLGYAGRLQILNDFNIRNSAESLRDLFQQKQSRGEPGPVLKNIALDRFRGVAK